MFQTFMLIGPGIISGPWDEADYREGLQFAEDIQEALGLPRHKLQDWLLDWQESAAGAAGDEA